MGRHKVAKQLCYRAVTAIGGCKGKHAQRRRRHPDINASTIELYLLPFGPSLRPSFTPRELRDWSELMTERGLRLRVPFEQFWDPIQEDENLALPEDHEPEEDELEFLREREGMKPYG